MAEKSIFWSTVSGVGDGSAAYTQDEVFSWLNRTLLSDPVVQGVLANYANTLSVSGTASPVSVATGAAVVKGIPYENTGVVSVAVPTPVVGPTGHRIVLRANYTAQTVRVALISSADGIGSYPAPTQNSSVWEVPLANISITTGGVITVQDARGYAHFNTRVSGNMLDGSVVDGTSIAIASNQLQVAAEGIDDTKIGSRVPTFPKRQGGEVDGWQMPGSTDYTPAGVMMQAGSTRIAFTADADQSIHIDFPVAYSTEPVVFGQAQIIPYGCTISGVTTTGFDLYLYATDNTVYTGNVDANWFAVGPS